MEAHVLRFDSGLLRKNRSDFFESGFADKADFVGVPKASTLGNI